MNYEMLKLAVMQKLAAAPAPPKHPWGDGPKPSNWMGDMSKEEISKAHKVTSRAPLDPKKLPGYSGNLPPASRLKKALKGAGAVGALAAAGYGAKKLYDSKKKKK